jgi:hypothetical protein
MHLTLEHDNELIECRLPVPDRDQRGAYRELDCEGKGYVSFALRRSEGARNELNMQKYSSDLKINVAQSAIGEAGRWRNCQYVRPSWRTNPWPPVQT